MNDLTIILPGIDLEPISAPGTANINYDRYKIPTGEARYRPTKPVAESDFSEEGLPPLIEALHLAFVSHHAVRLDPDMIWYHIGAGVAAWIKAADKAKLDAGGSKKTLHIEHDGIVPGREDNDWAGPFNMFTEKILANIEPEERALQANFTTTDSLARFVNNVMLMDTFQNRFILFGGSCCGIARIRLAGTGADWTEIHTKIDQLRVIPAVAESPQALAWLDVISDITAEFSAVTNGTPPDIAFWESIYKYRNAAGSGGGPRLSGWCRAFFPQHRFNLSRRFWEERVDQIDTDFNTHVQRPITIPGREFTPLSIQYALSAAPFTWKYNDIEYKYKVYAGALYTEIYDETTYAPAFGWVVARE